MTLMQYVFHVISSRSRMHHRGACGLRERVNAKSTPDCHEITRYIRWHRDLCEPHRRQDMLYDGLDTPSNVANRPDGRPERSDTCDPSTAIFIRLRVALRKIEDVATS